MTWDGHASADPQSQARVGAASSGADPGRLPRLLPAGFVADPVRLADHLARYGPPAPRPSGRRAREAMIAEVDRAGLAGRGGAGFPTGRKLAAVAARRNAIVVANGTEGEPASAKDKVLLAQSPHLVLDGAVAAAELVGASQAIIVTHPAVTDIVAAAAAERRRARLDRVRLSVTDAADRFVAGEASAVVHWLERGVPTPKSTPRRLSEHGLHGRPTLVQNVETLAHLALIARHGAAWFRALGTEAEPGSMLVTLAGAVADPGVYEVAIGASLRDVLAAAGGAEGPLSALLIGGYFGSWVDAGTALRLPLSEAGLRGAGAGVGAGLIAALPADSCGLAEAARIARYLAAESAGQCGPCVFGLDAIAGQMERLASGRGPDLARLSRWIGQVGSGRGACKHPDGAVSMVSSALRTFEPEIEQHARGWCTGTAEPAGVLPVPSWSQR
ncbi:MAG TPA: NADH-ubiquinone oxidoreductase-F iron-sulfur binding region domain-containing protein [Streptosporangiaceae bacterium]